MSELEKYIEYVIRNYVCWCMYVSETTGSYLICDGEKYEYETV